MDDSDPGSRDISINSDPTSSEYTLAGLTPEQVAERLEKYGPNVLPTPDRQRLWLRIAAEFVHFFALLLWVAAALAVIGGMPQLGLAIVIVVVVNGVFAFSQEYRADRAADRLRDTLPRRVTVRRAGRVAEISADDLVPGDVVVLNPGDRISADCRLVETHSLSIDVSMLTGESELARPMVGDDIFAGTFVAEGEGAGIVAVIGARTRLAAIAALTRHPKRASPLAKEIERLVRTIAVIAGSVGLSFFVFSVLLGMPASEGFLFAIGVTVALVPEGLLPTVTLSLAFGAQRMADRNALVRRLEAVETLGATTVICTDKTGTLTRNEMDVVEVWTPAATAAFGQRGYIPELPLDVEGALPDTVVELASAASLCSNGRAVLQAGVWRPVGDPMEVALDVFARRLGFNGDEVLRARPPEKRMPFDPRRRLMAVQIGDRVIVKGASDAILPGCTDRGDAKQWLDDAVERGLRVISVAEQRLPDDVWSGDVSGGLRLLGLVALEDPPRTEAAGAIAACRAAGIRVLMVTGDLPGTARAIGREVGLTVDGCPVVAGADLPVDDDALAELLSFDGAVICRVSPEEKLRIARVLQGAGEVVAMTGDGVNDGPALQQADIGVAMGLSGTDVAREAADMILLDDNFATIVAAVEQGRSTYANIRKSLTYHLTDNVAELTPFVVWALSAGKFPLALGVLQILFLDIAADILPATALGAEPPAEGTMRRPPDKRHLIDRQLLVRAFGVLGPVESIVEMTAFLVSLLVLGWTFGGDPLSTTALMSASGAAFIAVVLGQSANAFACRSSTIPFWKVGWRTNRLLLGAVAAQLSLLAVLILVPPLADVLEHARPPLEGMLVALLAIPDVLLADTLYKFRAERRKRATAGDS